MREYTNFEKMFFLIRERPRTKDELAKEFNVTIKTVENIKQKYSDVFIYSKKTSTYELLGFVPNRVPSILIYEIIKLEIDNETATNTLESVVQDIKKEPILTKETSSYVQHLLCRYFEGENRLKKIGYKTTTT